MLPSLKETANAFSEEQDKFTVNIKLPDELTSFKDINDFNKRLESIFKKFGITDKNGLEITGFDRGAEWYQILIDNYGMHSLFIVGVIIAVKIVEFRKTWYESEVARLTVKAMKEKKSGKKEEDKIIQNVLEEKIKEEVRAKTSEIDLTNGRTNEETASMLETGIAELVKEIDNGTEFHLSLNPPEYLIENQMTNEIEIDYSAVPELNGENKDENKALPEKTS